MAIRPPANVVVVPFDARARIGGPANVIDGWRDVLREYQNIIYYKREQGDLLPMLLDQQIRQICRLGGRPLTLGGDHSLSWYTLKALVSYYGRNITVIHLDAHHDSYAGPELNHYTVMKHIADRLGVRVIGVGYRYDIQKPYPAAFERMHDGLIYISVDVDYFDPGLVSSVGSPVACRNNAICDFSSFQATLRSLRPEQVVGADLVEWCADRADKMERRFVLRLFKELHDLLFAGTPFRS